VLQTIVNRIDLQMSLADAVTAPRASQRNSATTEAESAFVNSPEGQTLLNTYKEAYRAPAGDEIGAATGIEFVLGGKPGHGGGHDHGGHGGHDHGGHHGGGEETFIAVAEPVRRGGGSAAVVRPSR
jgi:gamma-glutamyltranspeptidase/glutathione hydrolase